MKDKFNLISYGEYFSDPNRIREIQEKWTYTVDEHTAKDLIILMEINEKCNEAWNILYIKEKEIRELEDKLHHFYDVDGERADYEYRNDIVNNILKNTKWGKEICVSKKKEKFSILKRIQKKGALIDMVTFVDEENTTKVCLQVEICYFNFWWDNNQDVCIYTIPNFVLDSIGGVPTLEDDQEYIDDDSNSDNVVPIVIDQIKEIIVDEKKYTFL